MNEVRCTDCGTVMVVVNDLDGESLQDSEGYKQLRLAVDEVLDADQDLEQIDAAFCPDCGSVAFLGPIVTLEGTIAGRGEVT